MQLRRFWVVLLAVLGLWAIPAHAQTTQVTTIQGTVVTFSGTHTTGTYADGSPWINVGVGTTTITDKSPKDVDGVGVTLHGCMVNIDPPNPTSISSAHGMSFPQGFDSRMFSNSYIAASNFCASFPSATLSAGKSIIVAESLASCTTLNGKEQCVESYDVITTVSSNPSAGQFRPPFAGTDKSLTLNKSNIRYDVLKDNPLVTGQPTLDVLEADHTLESIFFTPVTGAQQLENLLPTSNYNTPGWSSVGYAYGRPMNNKMQDVLMALHSNDTDANKETMAIRVVQNAIDIYGMFNGGTWWLASGALCPESQSMLLVGASLINNQAMMDIGSNTTYPLRWCSYSRFKYITAADVTPGGLARDPSCGANSSTEFDRCAPFTAEMIGRPAHNDQYWTMQPAKATALPSSEYAWFNSALAGYAMAIRWMSLEEEMAAPYFIDYMYSTTSVAGATPWPDGRWSAYALNSWYANACTSNGINANGFRAYLCLIYNNYRNSTPIDGSVTGSTEPNVGPTSTLVSPSSSTTQIVTAATITLAGTSADSDGTVTSTTATSTCDGSISNAGTATAWSFVVDMLAARSSCTVSIVATDNDSDVAPTITVSVLRTATGCTTLMDSFSLGGVGTWSVLNPECWVPMNGSLSWSSNRANSASAARNLAYFNESINNDQQVTVTLGVTPDASNWVYGLLRSSVSGSTYSGMSCTAQNPISYIARFVSGSRQQIGSGFSTASDPWASGDSFTCQMIGQEVCILQNGVELGCETDGSAVFTSGFTGAGSWGIGNNFDDFSAASAAGGGDITNPTVAITTPAAPIQVSATPYTSTAGTLTDNVNVVTCTWFVAENPAETGSCDTVSLPDNDGMWTANSVDLIAGNNTITVRVFDLAGNTATTSQVVNYQAAATAVGTITYPTNVVADSWSQLGSIAPIAGTFTAGQCTTVRLTNVSDPDPEIGGNQVTATGTDTWSARVRLQRGRVNTIEIDCLDAMGDSVLNEPMTRYVTSVRLPARR